jgi:hypothetical protein
MNSQRIKNYLENILPSKIVQHNPDMNNHSVVNCVATVSTSMDGFLSSIFQLKLEIEDKTSKE